MKSVVARVAGFGLTTAITALVTIVSIPLLIGAVGPGAWSDLVVGQAAGTFIAVLTAWGWAVTGPTQIAAAGVEERAAILWGSLRARGVLLIPSLCAVVVVIPLLVLGHRLEAGIGAAAAVVGALGGTWYYVGAGDSKRLLLLDTAPRAAGVLLGACSVALGAPLAVAPLVQLAGSALAVVFAGLHARGARDRSVGPQPLLGVLRGQSAGVAAAATSALYVALPLMVVTRVAPAAVPEFALADRLLRYGVLAAAPIAGFAQSWVPSVAGAMISRARRARGGALLWGAFGACAYALLAPVVARLLAGDEVALRLPLVLTYAAAAGLILASQIMGPAVLLSIGRPGVLATSTITGLISACLLVPLGALAWGAEGAAAGLAASELAVLALQLACSVRPLATDASGRAPLDRMAASMGRGH